MKAHSYPEHRNADSVTKRYLHKRGITSTSPLTSVSGDIIYCMCEQYSLGTLSFKGVVGLVTKDNSALAPTVDGIMGLWYFPKGASVPILNVLKNSSMLTQPQIGVWLKGANTSASPNPNSNPTTEPNAPGGEITFGGADPQRYSGDISYVDCEGDSPWTIPVGEMTVNGQTINTSGAMATLDTGTSLMLVSQTVSDAINSAIPGAIRDPQVGWFLPCTGNYPITITFGTRKVTIPYTALAVQDQTATTDDGSLVCLSAAMYPTGETAVISNWLLGDAFLKNVYTVFDFSTPKGKIGLASLASNITSNSVNDTDNNAATGGRRGMMSSSNVLQALSVVAGLLIALA
ncbi:hypothetical protein BGW39_009913 [Mortierella sp. 14UC]|nr:hypothetical protein BGW39_009913 [Mortierella sp. 14UC]